MTSDKDRNRQLGQTTEATLQNVATYRTPIVGILKGESVRIIATGDLPGHSPVLQYVDEQGRVDWDEAAKFTVVDPQVLPPSSEALREIARQISR